MNDLRVDVDGSFIVLGQLEHDNPTQYAYLVGG
jgi:hypothetical protein